MRVDGLTFQNFRNLAIGEIEPCADVNVIYGENAQGKTNLLEAIWMFCGGHSFRGSKENEMIGFDKEFFRIGMDFFSGNRGQNAEITYTMNRKGVKLNGVEKNSSSYLTEVFSAVIFSPEHLSLIKRGPSLRRRFLDGAICQHHVRFASLLSTYQHVLNQRNTLLKDIYRHSELKETLPIWDDSLINSGAQIIERRFDYFRQLREVAGVYHRGISGGKEELDIRYISSCGAIEGDTRDSIQQKLYDAFRSARHDDYRSGYTTIGPHRDDLEITINGLSLRRYGSQGQQRSTVLSLKLAEAELLSERNEEKPVILLDDVLSELDSSRQDFLLNKVDGYQVFVTCCEQSNKEQLQTGKVFTIENGVVR